MGPRGERVTEELLQRLLSMEAEANRWSRTDVAKYVAITEEMVSLTEGAGPKARALALRAHCTSLRQLNRLHEALEAAQTAQRLWLEAGEEVEWARTVTASIPTLVQLDRYKEATEAAEAALALFIRTNQLPAAARLDRKSVV